MEKDLKRYKLYLNINEWMMLSAALIILINIYGVYKAVSGGITNSISVMGIGLFIIAQFIICIIYKYVFQELFEARRKINKDISEVKSKISQKETK